MIDSTSREVWLVVRHQERKEARWSDAITIPTPIVAYLTHEEAQQHADLANGHAVKVLGVRRGVVNDPAYGNWKKYRSPYDPELRVTRREELPEYTVGRLPFALHVDQFMEHCEVAPPKTTEEDFLENHGGAAN